MAKHLLVNKNQLPEKVLNIDIDKNNKNQTNGTYSNKIYWYTKILPNELSQWKNISRCAIFDAQCENDWNETKIESTTKHFMCLMNNNNNNNIISRYKRLKDLII